MSLVTSRREISQGARVEMEHLYCFTLLQQLLDSFIVYVSDLYVYFVIINLYVYSPVHVSDLMREQFTNLLWVTQRLSQHLAPINITIAHVL